MAQITITSITWSTPFPQTYKPVSVSYRLATDPDVPASYTIVSTGSFVTTTGSFLIPVVIPGLDIDLIYTVKVVSLCGGFFAERTFFPTTPAAFSTGFTIGFDS